MNGAIARILLRYAAGVLVGPALGDALAHDPDVVNVTAMLLGLGAGVISELWYYFAKRFGWST